MATAAVTVVGTNTVYYIAVAAAVVNTCVFTSPETIRQRRCGVRQSSYGTRTTLRLTHFQAVVNSANHLSRNVSISQNYITKQTNKQNNQ